MLAFNYLTFSIHTITYANLSLGLHSQISLLRFKIMSNHIHQKCKVHINTNSFLVNRNVQRTNTTIKTGNTNNMENWWQKNYIITLKSLFYTTPHASFSNSIPSTFFFLEELHDWIHVSELNWSLGLYYSFSKLSLHCLNGKSCFKTQFSNFDSFSLRKFTQRTVTISYNSQFRFAWNICMNMEVRLSAF